ncbi:MAG TPA: hypothetical protein VFE23_04445 [Usitatibacter sp.]|jgi:hypothetical protein|nr:hypothetical protein [Usitatibacter sp.]
MNLGELSERDAAGEKAAIYAEIRHLGGVPMVALIFRHLATLPGALEWMWSALGPVWRRGEVQEAAWRVAREAPLVPIAAVPRAALAALGVDAEGLSEIRTVLGAYNRANPENMLTVLCILRLLDGHSARRVPAERAWTPPPAHEPLAPMGDIRSLPPQVSALFDVVAPPGEPGAPRVVQSLYRHFAHRPAFLALAVTLLRQRFDDRSIDASVHHVHAAMSATADRLVEDISATPAPHEGIAPVCRRFGGAVIPQMIAVGRLLEEALPGARDA